MGCSFAEEGSDERCHGDGPSDEEDKREVLGHGEEGAAYGDAHRGAEELGREIDAAGLTAFVMGNGAHEGMASGDEDEGQRATPHEKGGKDGVIGVEGSADAEGDDGCGIHAGTVECGATVAEPIAKFSGDDGNKGEWDHCGGEGETGLEGGHIEVALDVEGTEDHKRGFVDLRHEDHVVAIEEGMHFQEVKFDERAGFAQLGDYEERGNDCAAGEE